MSTVHTLSFRLPIDSHCSSAVETILRFQTRKHRAYRSSTNRAHPRRSITQKAHGVARAGELKPPPIIPPLPSTVRCITAASAHGVNSTHASSRCRSTCQTFFGRWCADAPSLLPGFLSPRARPACGPPLPLQRAASAVLRRAQQRKSHHAHRPTTRAHNF